LARSGRFFDFKRKKKKERWKENVQVEVVCSDRRKNEFCGGCGYNAHKKRFGGNSRWFDPYKGQKRKLKITGIFAYGSKRSGIKHEPSESARDSMPRLLK